MLIGIDAVTVLPDRTGGIETYFVELARHLVALGSDDRFLLFVQPGMRERVGVEHPRLRYVETPTASRSLSQAFVLEQTWLPLRARLGGVALVHHVKNYASMSLGFRQVLTLHDLFPHYFIEQEPEREGFDHLGKLALMLASASQVQHVVTVSEATAQHLRRLTTDGAPPITVTPLAPKTIALSTPAPPIDGLAPGYLLAIGKTLPYKNLPRLLRAYLASRVERPLVVAGAAGWRGDAVAAELHLLAAGSGGRIRLLGYVDERDLGRLYVHARGLIFPSLIEGFGLPPLEAASLGVAVAASAIAAHREVLGDAALSFDPTDEAAMVDAIRRLDADDDLCARLRVAGRARSHAFSWRATAERTLAVYARVAA